MQNNIRIILVNPSHPGNIGAAARAMKNMGFSRLYLVNPVKFPHPEAFYRSSRADDVVRDAVVVKSLDEALQGCAYVFGTSAREREMSAPIISVQEMSNKVVEQSQATDEIAIVFGREKHGLYNEEIRRCQYQVKIPTVANYSSLNLGAAVQVIVYELYKTMLHQENQPINQEEKLDLATVDELEGLYQHLEKSMIQIGFLDPENPRMMMPRFRQIFRRARLEKEDVNLLRGMLASVIRFVK